MTALLTPWPLALACGGLLAVAAGAALGAHAHHIAATLRRRHIIPSGAHRR
jgi:hypothetical protein